MGDEDAGADSYAATAQPPTSDEEQEEKKKRRFLWLWFAAAFLLLLLLFVVCTGDDEDEPVSLAVTTTTTRVPAPAPTGAPTLPAPAPATTSAPATTTQAPAATTTTEPGPIDVSGVWTFIIDVTKTGGACAGEEDEPVDPKTVTIKQEGDVLTVTGLNGTDPPWQGQIVDNTVTFAGERDEDRGRTVASFTLTVDEATMQLTGIEEWTWSGPGGTCPGSLSEVSAERA